MNLWWLIILLLVLYFVGGWAPFSPVRGSSLIHVILVVVFAIIVIDVLFDGGLHLGFHRLR